MALIGVLRRGSLAILFHPRPLKLSGRENHEKVHTLDHHFPIHSVLIAYLSSVEERPVKQQPRMDLTST